MNYKVYRSTALVFAICSALFFIACNHKVQPQVSDETSLKQNDKEISTSGGSTSAVEKSTEDLSAIPNSENAPPTPPEFKTINFCDDEVTEEEVQFEVDPFYCITPLPDKAQQITAIACGIPSSIGNTNRGMFNYNYQPQLGSLMAVNLSVTTSSNQTQVRSARKLETTAEYDETIPSAQSLAGKLTAGEIHDFSKWKLWEDIAKNDLNIYQAQWKMYPQERYCTTVQTEDGDPVVDATVELLTEAGEVLWTSRTDNTGKAESWNGFFHSGNSTDDKKIRVTQAGKAQTLDKIKPVNKGVNSVKLITTCGAPEALDIMFCVDATGSMGDEIDYLKAELADIINKTAKSKPELDIRLASIFYRCVGNSYTTLKSPFSKTVSTTTDFIKQQNADEGGTEAVEIALHEAINDFQWSTRARARLMFMVLDETPGLENEVIQKLHKATEEAAKKGIRIIPLVSSGVNFGLDKSLEYLMRSLALATNGTYAFLTDHSGIRGSHTAPSTDKYKVELLNDLLVRIIDQFTYVPECQPELQSGQENDTTSVSIPSNITIGVDTIPAETMIEMNFWPNPARFDVNVQTTEVMDEILLTDNSRKLLLRSQPVDRQVKFDLTDFPSGIYHILANRNGKWLKGKLVVAR